MVCFPSSISHWQTDNHQLQGGNFFLKQLLLDFLLEGLEGGSSFWSSCCWGKNLTNIQFLFSTIWAEFPMAYLIRMLQFFFFLFLKHQVLSYFRDGEILPYFIQISKSGCIWLPVFPFLKGRYIDEFSWRMVAYFHLFFVSVISGLLKCL